ncbi:MAG: hypothetical protein ACE14L_05320 [Terriglobales bacterium]
MLQRLSPKTFARLLANALCVDDPLVERAGMRAVRESMTPVDDTVLT